MVELVDLRRGRLWMECGGKLWAPKCKTTVVQVVNGLGRGVPGVVCSVLKGLVFNSGALHRLWNWEGHRWSVVF